MDGKLSAAALWMLAGGNRLGTGAPWVARIPQDAVLRHHDGAEDHDRLVELWEANPGERGAFLLLAA